MPDYGSAFALRDNPFSPRTLNGVDSNLLVDIAGDALALDEEPRLEPLFVPGAGPFQGLINRFEWFLSTGGYIPDEPGGALRSKAFRVIGPEGSGKSTLANRLVQRLKECGHSDLILIKESAGEEHLDQAIANVWKIAEENGTGLLCVVFDDVRFGSEKPLHDLHQELRQKLRRPVVMFEIFHHIQDIDAPPRSFGSRVDIEDMRTSWLSADHAATFLATRIEQFRVPSPQLVGALANFPFDAEEVGVAISGDGAGALTLRTLSRLLSRGLDLELMARHEDPIEGLDDAGLRSRIISLDQVYERAMDEEMGAAA